MKTVNSFIIRCRALAQVFILLCTYICIPACFSTSLAASKTDLDYADLNKLASLETIIYGSPRKNLPNEKRVDSLEKITFGKTHSGSLHSRIFSIASTLTGTNDNSLSPPMAPALDREDTLKGSAPEAAQESNLPADECAMQSPSDAKRARINKSLQEAMELYREGQSTRAEALFKNVLTLDSKNADANYSLGAIAESRGDWQNALHYYQVALKSNPTDEDTKNAIASMQSKISASNVQKQPASKQPKLSNQQVAALKAKVDQAADDYAKGNYDSAISNLKAVVAQAPDQADVYFALGQAYKAKNQSSEAAAAFTQAVKFAPDNKQYADALAEANNSQGQKQNSASNPGIDTFSSNNPDSNKKPGKNKHGQNNLANQNDSDWTPDTPGEITPFSDQGNNELGWQPAGAANGATSTYYSPGISSAYMPGYTYSNYIPYSMTTMMERAAIGGLAGAAIGSMLSPPGFRMRGAFGGGMVGGMMGGFMGGRHR